MKKAAALLLCIAMTFGLLAGCGGKKAAGTNKIALITMNPADAHWDAVEAGAMRAAEELDAEMVRLFSSGKENSQIILDAVSDGCGAILLSADGSADVAAALEEAAAAGVKIICVDAFDDTGVDAVFATDNKSAGKAAAETLKEGLEATGIREGTIGIINVNNTADSYVQREAGFREAFEGSGYTMLQTTYTQGDTAAAQSAAIEYIAQDAVGIFACCEEASTAAGYIAKAAGADTMIVGFDRSDAVQALIDEGFLLASVVQNSDVMGYEGAQAAISALNGELLGGVTIDTGFSLLKGEGKAAQTVAAEDCRIALIAMDQMDQRWTALAEGAVKAAEELGCEVTDLSPVIKNDDLQAKQIREAMDSGYNAIVIAAMASEEVTAALAEAAAAGMKIIGVADSADDHMDAVCSADNEEAGRIAAETMIMALEAKGITEGSIGIVNVSQTDEETLQREAGFRKAFEGKPYTLLDTQFCEGDAAASQTIAEKYIKQRVIGIFSCNKAATNGCGNAVKAARSSAILVGFDTSSAIAALMEEGFVFAAVVENSETMGYEGVKAAIGALKGENPEDMAVDTGVTVLTK